ncbi:ubiA prenyltransferase family protein [Desulfovibrio sp. A2]|nr:ubiA prenyltransferase family protein [Desulfovibrio sp. A2]
MNRILPYIKIARPDHWAKHIFIFPGIILALALVNAPPATSLAYNILIGFGAACLLASANYVINEWLDAETDKQHPEKCKRESCLGNVNPTGVFIEYVILVASGLFLSFSINSLFFTTGILFVISGIIYNVPPMRSKDIVFIDVLTESLNNPIRLVFGWAMVCSDKVPPLSLMLCFFFGGAFLMAAKRLSEYRHIVAQKSEEAACLYRRSFAFYTEESLLLSCFAYSVLASFLLGVLLIKYKAEYILTFPLFTWLFTYYLRRGLQPGSVAQKPEKLISDKYLRLITTLLVIAFSLLTAFDIPWLEHLVLARYSEFSLGAPW